MRSVRARPVLVAMALVGILVAAYAARHTICSRVGQLLVSDDKPATADAIVLTVDVGAAGVLEAADLYATHMAPRVAVFADPPTLVEREFARRGVTVANNATVTLRQLRALGIESVETIPTAVDGTTAEGDVLPRWLQQRGCRSVLVVAAREHARRVGRVLRRAMAPNGIRVLVRGTRYSDFDPGRWCESRDGLRAGIVESEKLLLDLLRHPVP